MLHPQSRRNAADNRAARVLDFAAEFMVSCLSGRGEAKHRESARKKMKTSFGLAVKLWSITSPEAWSRNAARQISLITINALSGHAGPKHHRRRVADAQITARLGSRQNVVETRRRRQPEDHVRQRVLNVGRDTGHEAETRRSYLTGRKIVGGFVNCMRRCE